MDEIRLQNKKNLKQRMNRLHLSVNKLVNYGINLIHQGSLKKGTGVPEIKNGNDVDLDADFIIHTDDPAIVVRKAIFKAIKENLRSHEVIENKKRVIRISVNQNGYNYHFDVSIKNAAGETAVLKEGNIKWV